MLNDAQGLAGHIKAHTPVSPVKIDTEHIHDVDRVEAVVLGVLAFAIAIYGFWPDLALSYLADYSAFVGGMF